MRTAIIISGDVKQIVFTPESDSDELVLAMFDSKVNIDLVITEGNMFGNGNVPFTSNVTMSHGEYLRIYEDTNSKILVLTPKKIKSDG